MQVLSEFLASISEPLVIWDTEFTAWPGSQERGWTGPGEYREIVQIGAIAIDPQHDFVEIAAFERIVRPKINPQLSDYFIDLTGITQDRVDAEGIDFVTVMQEFSVFVASWHGGIGSFGRDDLVLAENCDLCGIVLPIATERFLNLREPLETAIGATNLMSCDLPRLVGLPAAGHAHDALGDARAIASVLRHFARSGDIRKPK